MSIFKYFAKKQVGSLPNAEGTLSNARVHMKFLCFGNWHDKNPLYGTYVYNMKVLLA